MTNGVNQTVTDIAGPTMLVGVAAPNAPRLTTLELFATFNLVDWVSLIGTLVGIVWGIYGICHSSYKFYSWIKSWIKNRNINKDLIL